MKRCWTSTRITYARIISEGVPSAGASPPPPHRFVLWQFVPPVQFVNFLRLLLVHLLFMTRLFPILETARPPDKVAHSFSGEQQPERNAPRRTQNNNYNNICTAPHSGKFINATNCFALASRSR